jgi:hypothetical protein
MVLDKIIKFDNPRLFMPIIKFKDLPILVKNFIIKSNKKIYYNILINNQYLIYFRDIYDENIIISNCITSEHDNIDGYHNYFSFEKEIVIESIEIENYEKKSMENIYFQYDHSDLKLNIDEIKYLFLDYCNFTKKYFKFINLDQDEEIILKEIYDGNNLKFKIENNKKKIIKKYIPTDQYKFKFLKGSTYYVEYENQQVKKIDNIYIFNNNNYISSYYPIL